MLWLLCKLLFNDTATEGVLYYLSHCSSLQSRHCISTLLFFFFFYIYTQQAIPEKFLFQLQNSADPNCVITSLRWGKSCFYSCKGPPPAALLGSSCPQECIASALYPATVLPLVPKSGSWGGSRAVATLGHL